MYIEAGDTGGWEPGSKGGGKSVGGGENGIPKAAETGSL